MNVHQMWAIHRNECQKRHSRVGKGFMFYLIFDPELKQVSQASNMSGPFYDERNGHNSHECLAIAFDSKAFKVG